VEKFLKDGSGSPTVEVPTGFSSSFLQPGIKTKIDKRIIFNGTDLKMFNPLKLQILMPANGVADKRRPRTRLQLKKQMPIIIKTFI
jgi:hypothetical protein